MSAILALETSCDETAASVVTTEGEVLSSEVASQIEIHRAYGGVVPEVASRNHILHMQDLCDQALQNAGMKLGDISAFAATSGPGLVSSLLIGSTMAKALALAEGKPFFAINHLEGHLLSPFMSSGTGGSPVDELGVQKDHRLKAYATTEIPPHIGLIVSGGHTMILQVNGVGDYKLLGRTRDDAAGEAFDKVGKMLGLPYPGGPEIDRRAVEGRKTAYEFPRSFMEPGNFGFSFSGLKTAVLYLLPKVDQTLAQTLPDLCASFQEAVVEVLVEKTIDAARRNNLRLIGVSGGVSCNRRLREAFKERCAKEGITLRLTPPAYSTDNAAMIGFAAALRHLAGFHSALEVDVNPNLSLVSA